MSNTDYLATFPHAPCVLIQFWRHTGNVDAFVPQFLQERQVRQEHFPREVFYRS